jgi:hypothetical protein
MDSNPKQNGTQGRGTYAGTDLAQGLNRVKDNYAAWEQPHNLSTSAPDTFWSAARTILEQCCQVLAPGGHALFVTKAYVRGGQLVDFPGQWAQLCQAVGFQWLHEHHALLTTDHGTELGLFGGETRRVTARKSFFRRLAEAKGSPPIDWETVQCFQKPGGRRAP